MSLVAPDRLFVPGACSPTRRVIDVRAPVEVAKGALPGAVSLPILEDHERHAVGAIYAEAGQDAAVAEGERLTAAAMPARTEAWRAACEEEPSAFLCWRGGMRSELAQRFAAHPGTPRVEGGYKAVRAHLMDQIAPSLARRDAWVVTGPTGSGKTELLTAARSLPALLALDLEAAAEHRGSAFGPASAAQPAQATFEHRLALPLLLGRERALLLEDESRNIGRVHLPQALYDTVRSAPLLVLESPLPDRVRRIHHEYAVLPAREEGERAVLERLTGQIALLRRRLGGATTEAMAEALRDAHEQGAWTDPEAFRPVIEPLLTDYYDPLYRKATPTDGREVAARGTEEELLAWMTRRFALSPA